MYVGSKSSSAKQKLLSLWSSTPTPIGPNSSPTSMFSHERCFNSGIFFLPVLLLRLEIRLALLDEGPGRLMEVLSQMELEALLVHLGDAPLLPHKPAAHAHVAAHR